MDDPTLLSWIERGQNIAALLVAIGVAAEFALGFVAGPARRRVDQAKDAEMVRLKNDSASFELDIAKANKGAADALERAAKAEENLGNAKKDAALALQHAADANRIAEEERLKRVQIEEKMKPRSLKPDPKVVSALARYQGTEYTFSSVFADEESINLLKQVDSILHNVGWKRIKPSHAYPAINVYGNEQDFDVPTALISGIKISVDSSQPLTTLQVMPIAKLPPPVGAAADLAIGITADLAPPQEGGIKANIVAGTSMTVRIDIGRKP